MHVNWSSYLFVFFMEFHICKAIYFKYNNVVHVFLKNIQNKTNNSCECRWFKYSKNLLVNWGNSQVKRPKKPNNGSNSYNSGPVNLMWAEANKKTTAHNTSEVGNGSELLIYPMA